MTAAPKNGSLEKLQDRDNSVSPSVFPVTQGRCRWGRKGQAHPLGTAGYGSKRLRKECRDNIGKDHPSAGTGDNLQRPLARGKTIGQRRWMVWRMSPYERERRSNVLRGVMVRTPWPSARQRGSGYSAAVSGFTPLDAVREPKREAEDREGLLKPTRREGYASRRLSLARAGKVKIGKMACRAEIRTGYGKSVRPGSQGGFGKRDRWWN